MNPVTQRISRHLLGRIRRLAVLDLYQRASDVGLLSISFPFGEKKLGTAWQVSGLAASGLAGDMDRAHRLIARALRRAPTTMHNGFVDHDSDEPINRWAAGISDSKAAYQVEPKRDGAGMKPARRKTVRSTTVSPNNPRQLDSPTMFGLLREFLPPPNVSQTAVALLIARAVGESVADLDQLHKVLVRRNPVILLKIPIPGFERQCGTMLEEGLIAPYYAELTDIRGDRPLSERFRDARPEMRKRKIVTGSGRNVAALSRQDLTRHLSTAILGDAGPIVIVDETLMPARAEIAAAADIVLQCAGIDRTLVADLLHACLGIPNSESLSLMEGMTFDLSRLSLDALALAVRPGRAALTVLSLMASLAEAASDGHHEDNDNKARKGRSSRSSSALRDKPQATPVDMIQPEVEPSTKADTAKPKSTSPVTAGENASSTHHVQSLRVETLAGYGEARQWALDLKDDLPLWREGGLAWDEMSTKLLLSGPPGTGKTTYAKALCNSLQIPLIVSSVAEWLEYGYLGDVLQRMAAVFKAARESAPCILFIDEIDTIGSRARGTQKAHDDYWTSLITKLLELLDGALKSEGVIVVAATNLPEKIDPALVRSGRLEKHVVIPPPDADALAGILAHHLGADLAAVLSSAPDRGALPMERKTTASVEPRTVAETSNNTDPLPKKGRAHV
ncbi:ATP-binding protein [Hoeflea sp. BAL378]|uniref:ATP-binding protein n=1 Tax=Hoeflea sp. BAL378 TaxID=1547437 RepID=UPI0006923300|nr:ATP-binding protein [Hoeflea sp. BAL378]